MLGRDFSIFGAPHDVVGRLGDQDLWRGRVRVRWVNRNTILVLDSKRATFVVSLRGNVEVRLQNAGEQDDWVDPSMRQEAKRRSEQKEEEEFVYWFDDPRALLISRKEKEEYAAELRRQRAILAAEYIAPTRTIRINLMAVDFARLNVGDTLQIAAADMSAQCVKLLERDSWTVDRQLSGMGNSVGLHYGICSLCSLRIDDETTLLCTCDNELNRMQILDTDGEALHVWGEEGPKLGQFRRPVAITAHVVFPSHSHGKQLSRHDPSHPAWFLGPCERSTLEERLLNSGLEVNVGDFCLGRRPDDEDLYDLVYLDKSYSPVALVIRRSAKKKDKSQTFALQTRLGRGSESFPSIWQLIMSLKQLRKPVLESRPYALLAVAEQENARVQIFRYFWTESEIFLPSVAPLLQIGGPRNRFLPLRDPVDVSYSPTGELAIADLDRIIVLAPSMTVAKIVTQPYSPFIVTREQRELKAQEQKQAAEEARVEEQRKALGSSSSSSSSSSTGSRGAGGGGGRGESKERDEVFVNKALNWPPWPHLWSGSPLPSQEAKAAASSSRGEGQGAASDDADRRVTSVSFAIDGKLAVGYRSGGVLVFNGFKSLPCGDFHRLTIEAFNHILSFCSFADLESIRGCSRLFHNHTLGLRFQWRLAKMRPSHRQIMFYAFLRWCTNNKGELVFDKKTAFLDCEGNELCAHWLETASCPLNRSCPHSHAEMLSVGYREFYPAARDLGLELSQFKVAAYLTFGSKFVWKKERYIEALFAEYAESVERVQRHGHRPRYSVGGEMLRETSVEPTLVLCFKHYSDIMALLEEDFVGSKSIEMHPLFFRREGHGAMRPRGPYDFESIEKRIYVDPLEQYGNGIKISCVPLKTKQVKTLKGMEGQGLGEGLGATQLHIEAVRHLSDRAGDRLANLFARK